MSDRPRFCIAGLVLAAAMALLARVPGAEANEVCGAIPTELDEQAARAAFGAADAAAFIDSRAPLEAALDGVCDRNGDSARLFKRRASRVVFQIAAGATEPLPCRMRASRPSKARGTCSRSPIASPSTLPLPSTSRGTRPPGSARRPPESAGNRTRPGTRNRAETFCRIVEIRSKQSLPMLREMQHKSPHLHKMTRHRDAVNVAA